MAHEASAELRLNDNQRRHYEILFSRLEQSREQLERGAPDLRQHALVLAENRVGESALRRLQLENLFLDRIARDDSRRDHLLRLADSMRAIDCLRLDRRIPPGIEDEHI